MKKSFTGDKGILVGQYVLFPSIFLNSPCEMCGKCCNNNWVVELSEEEYSRYKTILRGSDLPMGRERMKVPSNTANHAKTVIRSI